MRAKGWKHRRELETAKTLDEIRKDAERDGHAQAQQPQPATGYRNDGYGGRGGGARGGGHRDIRVHGGDFRGDSGRGPGRGDTRGAGYDPRGSQTRGNEGRGHGHSSGKGLAPSMSSSRVAAPPVVSKILTPPASSERSGKELTKEKLELRAKNMRLEFMQDPSEKELLFSVDEVLGSPDAGRTIVQVNVEHAIECKAPERQSIIDMIVILYNNGKLTKSDVQTPMADIVEFIDSFVIDSPGAFGYLGEMLSAFFHMGALDVQWLCSCTGKLMDKADQSKVIAHTMQAMKKSYGDAETRSCFSGPNGRQALEQLLGAAEFQSMAAEYL